MDTLLSLRVFCSVAELKSFTSAADRLHLSPAMVSKHVMHLEEQLGTRLLNRTSRHVSLTETGALYFTQARQMLDGLDEVAAAVSNVTVEPRGTLRLSAPVWFANSVIAEALAEYHRLYPQVSFDIDLSGRMVNLVDEGFDLALRATPPGDLDAGLIARPLSDVVFRLAASPAYLDRQGRPEKLADLNGHDLLLYSGLHSNGTLTFGAPEDRETVKFQIVMESSNDTILYFAALQGMGMVILPRLVTTEDVALGRLEFVLPDAAQISGRLYAVYPSRKYLSAKVRSFIDFLTTRIGGKADEPAGLR